MSRSCGFCIKVYFLLSAQDGSMVSSNSGNIKLCAWRPLDNWVLYISLVPCSANKLKHCISILILWIFCLTKGNESLQFFKGMHKKWLGKCKKDTKPTPPPSPCFDQHYNLITCIAKRAFIWNLSLTSLICSMAQCIQREVSIVKKKKWLSFCS